MYKHMKSPRRPGLSGTIPVLIFVAFAGACPLLARDGEWSDDLEGALRRAKTENRPVLVDVFAPWCGFCRKLREEVYPATEVKKETERFITVRVNGEARPELMDQYGISGFPTILFLDKNGILIERVVGYQDRGKMARILREIFERRDQEDRVLARITAEPASVDARYRAGVYFYEKGDAERARTYFLEGWNLARNNSGTSRRDCLYNAAVTSMDLKDYLSAVSYWSIYLQVYAGSPDEAAYARYFRGVSYKYIGRTDLARPDLVFAGKNLNNISDRKAAQRILDTLP